MHENVYIFNSIGQAIGWATEVMRQRRFPSVSTFYREMEKEWENEAVQDFQGESCFLPQDYEDRFSLSMRVYECIDKALNEEQKKLLLTYYWGDFVTEERYRKQMKFQERMRQQEIRVRLSYRYSFRQIAKMIGCSDKTVARKIRGFEELVTEEMEAKGLMLPNVLPKSDAA